MKKNIILFLAIIFIVFGGTLAALQVLKEPKPAKTVAQETSEDVMKKLNKLSKGIVVSENYNTRKGQISFQKENLAENLPSIDKYPISVKENSNHFIEIFSSGEKAGTGNDSWLNVVAKDFNKQNFKDNSGNTISVRIRKVASGLGSDYITSGKYLPDAYTPSNELWGQIIKSEGTPINLVTNLVENTAGILTNKKTTKMLSEKYGSVSTKTIVNAVTNNEIAMGYTNPLSSSTGLNFLLSTLYSFNPQGNLLDETSITAFEQFQKNIPFVSYTTFQMSEAAKSGELDAFILEYQTYINSAELKSQYTFNPFGIKHENPLYSIGILNKNKQYILEKFADFAKKEKYQKKASEFGFNQQDNYKSEIPSLSGDQIFASKKIWKEKKNAGKPITAVFLCDTSGSMAGEPINQVKKSLISGSKNINKTNSIGLVTYSTNVSKLLPISKFDLNQKSLFVGAIEDLSTGGNTAMYDGIIVSIQMLMEELEKNPNSKPLLFVLTDGETNLGHDLSDIKNILMTLGIPIYTIGFNADISSLKTLSSINEAANINADNDDVVYKISQFFNAEM